MDSRVYWFFWSTACVHIFSCTSLYLLCVGRYADMCVCVYVYICIVANPVHVLNSQACMHNMHSNTRLNSRAYATTSFAARSRDSIFTDSSLPQRFGARYATGIIFFFWAAILQEMYLISRSGLETSYVCCFLYFVIFINSFYHDFFPPSLPALRKILVATNT